ncbi:MAG: hypothetical protein NC816_03640 [Candidatus Omnitrophica bacterium]|nr:hypothetical protein [Candidatus Omnitrophota bacterium]
MDPIKEAFSKVKEEIILLKEQIVYLKDKISSLEKILEEQQNLIKKTADEQKTADKTADFTALPHEIKGLKIENFDISTRNEGVTTDKPADRQTNQQTDNRANIEANIFKEKDFYSKNSSIEELKRVQDLLNSLDNIKKEIRLKFKSLTNREMLLFSTIYSLEEQGIENITYRLLAENLNLTESSIRDYTNKLFSKNLPLLKIKDRNKQVRLKISDEFKKIVSLQTLIKLREI